MKRAYADLSGGQLHYRTAGDGPPLFLFHPNGFSSDYFADLIPLLAERFRVIAPDRWGHGQSDPLPADFPRYEEDVEGAKGPGRIEPYLAETKRELMDVLGVESAFVLGQHTGSHVSIELSIRYPERVRKLVLVSITDWQTEEPEGRTYEDPPEWAGRETPYLGVERLQVAHGSRERLLGAALLQEDGSHLAHTWQMRAQGQASSTTSKPVMQRITMMALQCLATWPDTSPQVMLYYYASRRLPHVRVPTLLLAGEEDKAGMFIRQQVTLLPPEAGARHQTVPGGGAFLALEAPEALAAPVLEFFSASGR